MQTTVFILIPAHDADASLPTAFKLNTTGTQSHVQLLLASKAFLRFEGLGNSSRAPQDG